MSDAQQQASQSQRSCAQAPMSSNLLILGHMQHPLIYVIRHLQISHGVFLVGLFLPSCVPGEVLAGSRWASDSGFWWGFLWASGGLRWASG